MRFRNSLYRWIKRFFVTLMSCIVIVPAFMHMQAHAESFAAIDFRLGHHKHESILCHSGGMSSNMTWQGELQVGVASSDFRYYMYYNSGRCFSSGKIRDRERSNYVQRVDEEIGLAVRWEIQW